MSPEYLSISHGLLEDYKRLARIEERNSMIRELEAELYANKGEDPFYEYAIKAVIDKLKQKSETSPSMEII